MSQPYDIPLFGEPDAPLAPRAGSAKDRDDALHKVTWRRYKGAPRVCDDCFMNNVSSSVNSTWARTQGGVDVFLCYRHKALRLENEQLNH